MNTVYVEKFGDFYEIDDIANHHFTDTSLTLVYDYIESRRECDLSLHLGQHCDLMDRKKLISFSTSLFATSFVKTIYYMDTFFLLPFLMIRDIILIFNGNYILAHLFSILHIIPFTLSMVISNIFLTLFSLFLPLLMLIL